MKVSLIHPYSLADKIELQREFRALEATPGLIPLEVMEKVSKHKDFKIGPFPASIDGPHTTAYAQKKVHSAYANKTGTVCKRADGTYLAYCAHEQHEAYQSFTIGSFFSIR